MSSRKTIGLAGLAIFLFIAVLYFMKNMVYINSEERGVVPSAYEESGHRPEPLEPGWHLLRIGEKAVIYNLEPQTYVMPNVTNTDDSIRSRTSDGQEVFVDASVTYRINPDTLLQLHINWHNRYEDSLVRPAARSFIRDVISQYTFFEITTKRPEVEKAIFNLLNNFLMENYLILEKFTIQDIH